MPRGRTYNRNAVVKALRQKYGVYFYRNAKRHEEYRRDAPSGPPYTGFLPRHRNIAEGTVKSFLTQLGIGGSVRSALGLLED